MAITKQRIKGLNKKIKEINKYGVLQSIREVFDEIEREKREEKTKTFYGNHKTKN